jgi:hypothetical protein
MKKVIDQQVHSEKKFHEVFPYALEWFVKEGKKNLQHNAYFPYEDYRNDYARKLKSSGAIKIRRYKTEPK